MRLLLTASLRLVGFIGIPMRLSWPQDELAVVAAADLDEAQLEETGLLITAAETTPIGAMLLSQKSVLCSPAY